MRLRTNSESKPVGLDKRLQSYLNEDLLSTPYEDRTWTAWHYLAFYACLNADLSIMLSFFRLLEQGFTWWHIALVVFIANILLGIIMVFNGKSGSKYGLPFVMIARSCFGIRGSAIVGVLRALLSILLYSLNLYTISYLLSIMLSTLSEGFRKIPNNFPADSNMDPQRAITFSIAWVINLLLAVFGQRVIRRTMLVKAVLFTLFIVGVVIWAAVKTSGPGPILQSGDEFLFVDYGDFFEKFFPAIASSMGVWFYMAINIADFTRYARSNGAQVIGQLTGLPLFATIFSIAGMSLVSMYLVSAAANPGEILNIAQLALMGKSTHPELISVVVLFLSFALLVTNLLANLVASSYAISNLWPSRLGFRSGAVLSALLSVLCMPWTAMSRMDQLAPYLSVYSVAISCIVGIQLVDYFYVNRQRIDIDDLAFRDGQYWFRSGFNPFAFLALLGGLLVNLPWALAYLGVYKIVWMSTVFQFGWMIGPAVSAGIYWLLVRFVGSFYHNNDLYYSTVGGAAMEMKPQAAFKLNNDLALIDALAGNNNSPGKDKDSTSTASTKVFD